MSIEGRQEPSVPWEVSRSGSTNATAVIIPVQDVLRVDEDVIELPERWPSHEDLDVDRKLVSEVCASDDWAEDHGYKERGWTSEVIGLRIVEDDAETAVDTCLTPLVLWRKRGGPECQIAPICVDRHHSCPPTHISASAMEEPDIEDAWDLGGDNDALRHFVRNRRNLVIDSIRPHLSPHIVITPAEESWDDYYIPCQNRVEPQFPDRLMVPPLPIIQYSWYPPQCQPPQATTHPLYDPGRRGSPTSWRTRHVFSLTKFRHFIDRSSTERLIFYHVVIALRKCHRRAAAFAASKFATSFCQRYSNPEFIQSLERPFKWSDPAEILLLNSRYHLGTTVIESPCPFSIPHIIVNSPPPQNPWIPWENATNNPQDCGYGNLLVVPSRSVSFVNTRDEAEAFTSSSCVHEELFADPPENTSRPETPVPDTPIRQDAELINGPTCDQILVSPVDVLLVNHTLVDQVSRPQLSRICMEKEDDLPPFDEWYQNIAQRAQFIVVQ